MILIQQPRKSGLLAKISCLLHMVSCNILLHMSICCPSIGAIQVLASEELDSDRLRIVNELV